MKLKKLNTLIVDIHKLKFEAYKNAKPNATEKEYLEFTEQKVNWNSLIDENLDVPIPVNEFNTTKDVINIQEVKSKPKANKRKSNSIRKRKSER